MMQTARLLEHVPNPPMLVRAWLSGLRAHRTITAALLARAFTERDPREKARLGEAAAESDQAAAALECRIRAAVDEMLAPIGVTLAELEGANL